MSDRVTRWLTDECKRVFSDVGHGMKYEEYRLLRNIVHAPVHYHWTHQDRVSKANKES